MTPVDALNKTLTAGIVAEWHPCDAILLAWPFADSDWQPLLSRAQATYTALLKAIVAHSRAVILCAPSIDRAPLQQHCQQQQIDLSRCEFITLPLNDTWVRDYGPIGYYSPEPQQPRLRLLDFQFNAWGDKYASTLDNQVTQHLQQQGLFACPVQSVDFILEGGSIDSDGQGSLLTTAQCLRQRIGTGDLAGYQRQLQRISATQHLHCLHHGGLAGDDTDSHIDTLVRFANPHTLLYVACDQPDDSHYAPLQAMHQELKQLRQPNGQPYTLHALPLPQAHYNEQGQRLPATYANFLFVNQAILLPVYRCAQDAQALAIMQRCFPEHQIISIDCCALIEQFGSLHCATMQLPKGSYRPQALRKELH